MLDQSFEMLESRIGSVHETETSFDEGMFYGTYIVWPWKPTKSKCVMLILGIFLLAYR